MRETGIGRRLYLIKGDTGSNAGERPEEREKGAREEREGRMKQVVSGGSSESVFLV